MAELTNIVWAEVVPLDALADEGAVVAELALPREIPAEPARPRVGIIRRVWRFIGSTAQWFFGVASLILGLAVLATIPILQLLSLGYLLEVSGRVARSGRLRDGFIGVRHAARAGSVVLGVWVLFWPLRFVSSMWTEARMIDPNSPAARNWHIGLFALSVFLVFHVISACLRGGRLRSFLIPRPIHFVRQVTRRGAYARARDAVWDFVARLRLPYYFWLGARGFAGAVIWLALPVTMLAIASQLKPGVGVLCALVGGAIMAFVLMHLPFLQTRFAAENRFGAMFELRANRQQFARAPIAFFIALVFTLALALPLYLLKIEIVPREAAWLPSLLFVMSIFPARLLTGWACGRARRRVEKRNWFFRLSSRFAMLPVAAIYVFMVYFTQYLSWYGMWSLYEQHAFLLPVPFLGM